MTTVYELHISGTCLWDQTTVQVGTFTDRDVAKTYGEKVKAEMLKVYYSPSIDVWVFDTILDDPMSVSTVLDEFDGKLSHLEEEDE